MKAEIGFKEYLTLNEVVLLGLSVINERGNKTGDGWQAWKLSAEANRPSSLLN